MDKKEILSNASSALQKKPNWPVRARRWIKMRASAFWRWLCGLNKLVFFNIILLALVCAMLFVMLGQVKTAKKSAAASNARVAPAQSARSDRAPAPRAGKKRPSAASAANRPTIVVSRNGAPIVESETLVPNRPAIVWQKTAALPLRRAAPLMEKKAKARKIPGTLVVDGHGRKVKLPPMAAIGGDLVLQNMRTFVLPCGTRIGGNLLLRNVRLLRFCGGFDIAGDIYVSSDSSFGPIPKNARLGGQVIF
jgi:hypothetical protein